MGDVPGIEVANVESTDAATALAAKLNTVATSASSNLVKSAKVGESRLVLLCTHRILRSRRRLLTPSDVSFTTNQLHTGIHTSHILLLLLTIIAQ